MLLGTVAIGYTLGLDWLIAAAAAAMAILAAAMTWPPSRRPSSPGPGASSRRTGSGPAARTPGSRPGTAGSRSVLYTVPADFGERVWLWCRAGITAGDLEAAREILRAACWASDVRVVVNDRRSHIVVLEVIRRLPAGRHAGGHAEPGLAAPGPRPGRRRRPRGACLVLRAGTPAGRSDK